MARWSGDPRKSTSTCLDRTSARISTACTRCIPALCILCCITAPPDPWLPSDGRHPEAKGKVTPSPKRCITSATAPWITIKLFRHHTLFPSLSFSLPHSRSLSCTFFHFCSFVLVYLRSRCYSVLSCASYMGFLRIVSLDTTLMLLLWQRWCCARS